VTKQTIATYSPGRFRENYITPAKELNGLLKPDFTKFFAVKVEALLRLMKLPVPPVRTTNHTLIYLTQGEATMTVGSETFKIFRDECLFVPAGQVYSFSRRDKNKGYLCNFSNDFLIGRFGNAGLLNDFEFLRVWGNPRVKLDKQTSAFVLHLLKRIRLEYSHNGLNNATILQSYFISLLCEVNSVYKPLASGGRTHAVDITNRFKSLLFTNFRSTHRVSDYAALLNITPNHLNKVVKKISGKSPTRWIDEAIVLEAKVLLYQSNLNIGEVGEAVGISDQSYFSRLFKKYESVTPLQFRQMIEKSQR
jgi:AraC-like DNA-binding protein